jgi:phage terminase large subunit
MSNNNNQKNTPSSTKSLSIDFKPTKKQFQMIEAFGDEHTTEILYGGSWRSAGSAKSYGLSAIIIIKALQYPGIRIGLARNELTTLKKTTLVSFFEVLQDWGIKEYVNYNSTNGTIIFDNGSEVILSELKNKPGDVHFTRLGGLLLTFACIDEVGEIDQKAYNIYKSRVGRWKNKDFNIKPILLSSCNPIKNWLYRVFYKPWTEGSLPDNMMFIQALPKDNPHLPQSYLDNLATLDNVSKQRLLYGKWEYGGELNIMQYEKILEWINRPRMFNMGEDERLPKHYLSVDVARLGKDRTVIFVFREDCTLVEILSLEKTRINETVEAINKLKKKYNIGSNSYVSVDEDGVGGGVVDLLPGCKSIVNNSRPLNDENYQNLKTQLIAKLAEKINKSEIYNNCEIDIDVKEDLVQELSIVERVDIDKDGKVRYTSKDDIKRKLGRSPDYLDGLAYMMIHFMQVTFVEDFEVIQINY